MDLLVVTGNGYGKRTQISPVPQTNRGAKGVKTIGPDREKRAPWPALWSYAITTSWSSSASVGWSSGPPADGISRRAAPATGVRVMNLKDDDLVSAMALVVDTGDEAEGEPDASALDVAAAGATVEPVDDVSGDRLQRRGVRR